MSKSDRVITAGPGCCVPAEEIRWSFGPSGGPGGQHANRANTRVEAELDLTVVRGIDEDVRVRLVTRLGSTIRVTVDRYRSQARNRERALGEIEKRIRDALVEPTLRRATRPARGANERRLETKRRRGARKAERRGEWN
ncbi:MAG TPA: aminoacyl-tRNA hydrolase [Acidimicrobiaceae bacterium]|nr:aminoacyl-tRNA hydrolase [Acidimicrobiaceae bacterium]HCV34904.1 aminoacyl-tRNA hydrolase [Acidimicrobiaceae bacterium]